MTIQRRLASGGTWIDSGAVFVNPEGHRLHPDTISNWFSDFLKRKELKHIRFHALRHTSASILIAQGVADTAVSLRLGHTNANTTRAIYAHSYKKQEAAAADLLAEAIKEAK